MIKPNNDKPFQVAIIESERGWGQKTDSIDGFDSRQEADDFIKTYNSKNDKPITPDWYMYAAPLYSSTSLS